MDSWKCCRTCLENQFLHPIFSYPEHCYKYTNIIFATTGVKVEINDSLPQQMCASCVTSINENFKFRKRCLEANNVLVQRLERKQVSDIKIENTNIFKQENDKTVSIDISGFVIDDDFNDFDDNLPLDTLQDNCKAVEKSEKNNVMIEFETEVQDVIEEHSKFKYNKRHKNINNEIRKKKISKPQKKQNGKQTEKEETIKSKEETDRVKEEIECEYCHKILTSKLSLRNHYKIHTGFDVVCEHCGKKFITRRLLLMHCRAKHGYEKTDKCSYCDYRASNAEQVKIHERLHTGEKPYICSQCGAGFHRKSSYLQHVAIHLPEKTVQCDQCPARFKSVTLMRIHKNRHRAPQYTFKCLVCDNSFARRRNVARHLTRIHGLAPEQQHIHRLKIG